MLIERRKIDFSEEDLLEAIAIHDENSSQWLADSEILGFEIETDGESTDIRVKVRDFGSEVEELVLLPFPYVIAAMIRYCIDEGIPIPRRSQKKLEISGDYVSLVLRVNSATVVDSFEDDEESAEAA